MRAARANFRAGALALTVVALATSRPALATAAASAADSATAADADGATASIFNPPPGVDRLVPLAVVVNGVAYGNRVAVVRAGDVLLQRGELAALFTVPPGTPSVAVDGGAYVSLRGLAPALAYALDPVDLVLQLTLHDARALGERSLDLGFGNAPAPMAASVPSAFLDYTVGAQAFGPLAPTGFVDTGYAAGSDLISTTATYSGGRLRRGLSAASRDDQAHVRRFTLGDDLAGGGEFGGSVVVGGLAVARAFDVAPDFVRTPAPGVSGTALAPATADVYVNGSYVRSVQIAPGRFDLAGLPLATGATDVRVVLRDAAGNASTLVDDSYRGARLLRRGVSDYAYHLGFVRRHPFGDVDAYGPLAALGTYAIGLTDTLTAGVHAEATRGLTDGGFSLDAATRAGEFGIAAAHSDAAGTAGDAGALTYQYVARSFSAGAQFTAYGANFSNLSLDRIDDRRSADLAASVAIPLGHRATLALERRTTHFRDSAPTSDLLARLTTSAMHAGSLELTAERSTGSFFSGGSSLPPIARPVWTIGANFIAAVGNGGIASVGTSTTPDGLATTIDVSRNGYDALGTAYAAHATLDRTPAFDATVVERTPVIDVDVTGSAAGDARAASIGASGSLVAAAGRVFLSRPAGASYALVHVDGAGAGTTIDRGGQPVARTDRQGDAIVTNLEPYAANRFTIAEAPALVDVVVGSPERVVVPHRRAAALATFAQHRLHVTTGTLAIGGAPPAEAAFGRLRVITADGERMSDLGEGGEFYFDDLATGRYAATATYGNDLHCSFELVVPSGDALATDVGALTCTP